jgi:hypothetical protein
MVEPLERSFIFRETTTTVWHSPVLFDGYIIDCRFKCENVPNYLYVAPSSSAFDELWFYSCTEAHETMALYLSV